MKQKNHIRFSLVLGIYIVSPANKPIIKSANTNAEKVASDLVNKCNFIIEGEIVMLIAGLKRFGIIENIVLNINKGCLSAR